MPKTKTTYSKGKTKPDRSKTPCTALEPSVVNIFNQCHGFQVGEHNTQTITSDEASNSDLCRGAQGSRWSKNDIGLFIVRNILQSTDRPTSLCDLKEAVREVVKNEKAASFKDMCGWPLEDFLTLNKTIFDVSNKGQIKIVRLRNAKSKQKKSKCTDSFDMGPKDTRSDIDTTGIEPFVDIASETKTSVQQSNWKESYSVKENTNSTETKRMQMGVSDKYRKPFPNEGDIDDQTFPEFDHITDKFKTLIKEQESSDLLFISGHDVYTSNPVKFQQDVVSMWNTPQKPKAYIVIGVKAEHFLPHSLIGNDIDVSDTFYEELYDRSYFTMKPMYKYYRIKYDSKVFGLIEISSSCGHGQPIIVTRNIDKGQVSLKENELWYRKGKHNVVCQPSDLTTGSIYQWFLGTLQKHDTMSPCQQKEQKSENLNLVGLQNKNPPKADSKTEKSKPIKLQNFSQFWSSVHELKKGHFVLISGNVPNTICNLIGISMVPWVAVFDFDIYSCSNGLLNAVQDSIEKRRHLQLGTWQEPPQSISERGTWWCFMRGRREIPDSRTDLDGTVENPNVWLRQVKTGVNENCENLAGFSDDYTVLTVVMLWPKDENLTASMFKFLDRLVGTLSYTPNIVICINENVTTEMGNTKLMACLDDYRECVHICKIQFETLCLGITNHTGSEHDMSSSYDLPKSDDCVSPPITDKDANWLREDLEILYLTNPYTKAVTDKSALGEEINSFYKGGNLHWFAWYERGVEKIGIDRDILQILEDMITPHLEHFRTSVITLLHSPGSGGSTLAQRILWKFHGRIPCIDAKLGTISKSKDLCNKVFFIYERTQLPVLLLIDGEEESKVKGLLNMLKYTIILYVKRYPYRHPIGTLQTNKVFLKGAVSGMEAEKLAVELGERCNSSKRKALEKLRKEVQNKVAHQLYEFGMTVYHHEFKGVVSYVKGYLQLDQNPKRELLSWQRCLGYLALVYYYGQSSIPCQFFATLFNKPSNYNMSLEHDFPHPCTEFIVYDTNERRQNNLRICHHEVAKEILEQILSTSSKTNETRTDCLGINACRNLARFCKEFVEYASKKKTKTSTLSTTIRYILMKTFIYRDEKDMGDNEEQLRRKPVLSKIMIDIPAGKPLFTERLQVLEYISNSFPNDPNFLAHVGRFYAFCRPGEEEKAESCFKTALALCETENKGKAIDDLDDGMRSSLMHIFHMYGNVKLRAISKYTGRSPRDKVKMMTSNDEFNERIRELVEIAEIACNLFTESRNATPRTQSVYVHAYTGEIQVRIQICDYVKKHFEATSEKESILKEFLNSGANESSKNFVENSISAVENLILECYRDVQLSAEDLISLRKLVQWYNEIFKKQVIPEESLGGCDDVKTKRLKIATKKLQFGGISSNLGGIENITDENAIGEIIVLYEEIFEDAHRYGLGSITKKELEHDYREWIFAIRHEKFKKDYMPEDVLLHVQNWHEYVRSPMSTFYVFVLKSLLGFGTATTPGKTDCLIDATDMKEGMMQMNRLIIRPNYPREWLGNCEVNFKRLIAANRKIGISFEDKEQSRGLSGFAVCKGTISYPNTNKVGGYINYDLKVGSAKVFFIPKRVDLIGSRYVGKRVEFNLAFTIEHGYEAFNVKLLKRHGCGTCSANVEFTSVDSVLPCFCGTLVHKDPANEIQAEI